MAPIVPMLPLALLLLVPAARAAWSEPVTGMKTLNCSRHTESAASRFLVLVLVSFKIKYLTRMSFHFNGYIEILPFCPVRVTRL